MYITEQDLKRELNQASDANVEILNRQQIRALAEIGAHIFDLNLQNAIFSTIQFPSLPRNFSMLMSKVEWPEKSWLNPNNSLGFNPQAIDKDDAQDIAKQCFDGDRLGKGMSTGIKQTMNPEAYQNESFGFDFQKELAKLILEDTKSMRGVDISVPDNKDINTRMISSSTDVINAITVYIKRSMEAVKGLIEMTSGSSGIIQVKKVINTANSASKDTIRDWLDQRNAVAQDTKDSYMNIKARELKDHIKYKNWATIFLSCLMISDIPGDKDKIEKIRQEATK